MLYFTYAWACFEEDHSEPIARYGAFIRSLSPTDKARMFEEQPIGLHDAYFDRAVFSRSSGELTLSVLAGDNRAGYWLAELSYFGAQIDRQGVLQSALTDRPTEILYTEFAQVGGRMSHGFMIYPKHRSRREAKPYPEFRISFDRFDYALTPVNSRELRTRDDISEWRD